MEIPDYIVINALRHMERIVACCRAPLLDTKTANALRLASRDIAAIKKYVPKKPPQQ